MPRPYNAGTEPIVTAVAQALADLKVLEIGGYAADQPGFGSQLSALAGLCGMTGVAEGPPMLLYGPYIDYIASLLGASAAMAAVIRSRRSGKGALIDLSQYECGLMFMGAALHEFF